MSDAVTSQTIFDGTNKTVMKFTNLSDGTGESGVAKVDVSALTPAGGAVTIERIWFNVAGMVVQVIEDASSDVVLFNLNGTDFWDFTAFGGVPITGASGYTGDIRFTTSGHTSGDSYTIILEMRKTVA